MTLAKVSPAIKIDRGAGAGHADHYRDCMQNCYSTEYESARTTWNKCFGSEHRSNCYDNNSKRLGPLANTPVCPDIASSALTKSEWVRDNIECSYDLSKIKYEDMNHPLMEKGALQSLNNQWLDWHCANPEYTYSDQKCIDLIDLDSLKKNCIKPSWFHSNKEACSRLKDRGELDIYDTSLLNYCNDSTYQKSDDDCACENQIRKDNDGLPWCKDNPDAPGCEILSTYANAVEDIHDDVGRGLLEANFKCQFDKCISPIDTLIRNKWTNPKCQETIQVCSVDIDLSDATINSSNINASCSNTNNPGGGGGIKMYTFIIILWLFLMIILIMV